jgi:hypothetical protein
VCAVLHVTCVCMGEKDKEKEKEITWPIGLPCVCGVCMCAVFVCLYGCVFVRYTVHWPPTLQ